MYPYSPNHDLEMEQPRFLGFLDPDNRTRPLDLRTGDLAIAVSTASSTGVADAQVNLGGGLMTSVDMNQNTGTYSATARLSYKILTASDISGTTLSVTGNDPSVVVILYRIPAQYSVFQGAYPYSAGIGIKTLTQSGSHTNQTDAFWVIDALSAAAPLNIGTGGHTNNLGSWDNQRLFKASTLRTASGLGSSFYPEGGTALYNHTGNTSNNSILLARSYQVILPKVL